MTEPEARCAVRSERRGDSMLGTAPPQRGVLLVHQPGPWGPRGLTQSRCDPAVAHRIDAAGAALGLRLQAIRRPGKHEVGVPAGGFCYGIARTDAGDPAVRWWGVEDFADAADELEGGWPRRPPDEIDAAPLYLVCVHGRHDPCCALRGRPVANALEDARPGRVWETTHLGGDRFAANLLVLPGGDLYGRVPPALAPVIAERADAGELVPRLMRGRIGLTPIAQAALVFAYDSLEIARRDALAVASVREEDAHRADVTLTTPDGPVVVTVIAETSDAMQLTCNGPRNARAREFRGVELRVFC